jgi:hypothetical protein
VPFSRFRERPDASATFYAGAGFAGAALVSVLSQPLAQPSKSSFGRKCYASERASNNSTGSGALGVVIPKIEPVLL